MEDINKIEQQLSEVMPPKNAERFGNVLRKFTKDASSDENVEGIVRFILDILFPAILTPEK